MTFQNFAITFHCNGKTIPVPPAVSTEDKLKQKHHQQQQQTTAKQTAIITAVCW